MPVRAVTLASAPGAAWDGLTFLGALAWSWANWIYEYAWLLGLVGAIAGCAWVVVERRLSAVALERRTCVELVPSRQFETTGEEIGRFGAQLIRAAGAGPWWAPRSARTVRVRLRADGSKPLSYRVEAPASWSRRFEREYPDR